MNIAQSIKKINVTGFEKIIKIFLSTFIVKRFHEKFILFLVFPVLCSGQKQTLTIDDAVRLALNNNLEIKQIEKDLNIARAGLAGANADLFLPGINLNASATYQDENSVLRTSSYADNYSIGLGLTKPLFTGFRLCNTRQIAKANFELAVIRLSDKKNEVGMNVREAFYNLLLKKQYITINEELGMSLKDHLDFVNANYQRGLTSEYDLVRSRVQYKNSMPQLLKARNDYDIQKNELCNLIMVRSSTNIRFSGVLLDSTNIKLPYINEDEILSAAISNNIDIKNIDYSLTALELNKGIIAGQKWPSLLAFFNYQYDYRQDPAAGTTDARKFIPNWNTGLQFSLAVDSWIPFISKQASQERSIRENIEKLELMRKEAVDSLVLKVRNFLMLIHEAEQNIESQRENVKQARLGFDIASKQYRQGSLSAMEMTDAEVAYNQAQANYLQAVFDRYSNILELKKIIRQ